MEPLLEPTHTVWSFPFAPQDWEQTPPAVQAYVRTLRDEVEQLHDRVETLQARLTQNSTTSSRPPSADAPYKKPRHPTTAAMPRQAGGKPGHPGHRQALLPPTTVHELRPERCACGNTVFALTSPYYGLPTAFPKKWTCDLPMNRAWSGRCGFEADLNRFALIPQVLRTQPCYYLHQQAVIRARYVGVVDPIGYLCISHDTVLAGLHAPC